MGARSTHAKPRKKRKGARDELTDLFNDEVEEFTVADWRKRNLRLSELLVECGLYDQKLIPPETHRLLTESLIHVLNGAATDPQNAGHVRAQNENVIHFGLAAGVSAECLTIALEAGFIHDLNKAVGEPLRQDDLAVRDAKGRIVPVMTTMAQIVGLNHLGERTRKTLDTAMRLPKGAVDRAVADRIDRCIVHHGLGSSQFIRDLIAGKNPWWGDEFVDGESQTRKLVHPSQPSLTLESVIHDLADSTQQMQGGAAWLMKYPAGFWRASGRSLADMMSSAGDEATDGSIALSLRLQIAVETETCREIIGSAKDQQIIDRDLAFRLSAALEEEAAASERWIDNSPEYLATSKGASVYHDVARSLSITPDAAHEKLKRAIIGTPEEGELEPIVWESGRRVDLERARALSARIHAAARPRS